MKLCLVLAALALGALGCAPAHALESPLPKATSLECVDLIRKFDGALPSHANAPKAVAAKNLRAQGEQLCNQGDYDDGVKDLRTALKYIGAKEGH